MTTSKRRLAEPAAVYLRRTGQLWPENLTDDELIQEIHAHATNTVHHPISWRMLQTERARRGVQV